MHSTSMWLKDFHCKEVHKYGLEGWRPCADQYHEHQWIVHHNGDYSGNVRVVNVVIGDMLEMPFDVMFELVGQMVQSELIEQIEQESGIGTLKRVFGGS